LSLLYRSAARWIGLSTITDATRVPGGSLARAHAREERGTTIDQPVILGGRYLLEHELGRGGMAKVYHGEDTVLGRTVAIRFWSRNECVTTGTKSPQSP